MRTHCIAQGTQCPVVTYIRRTIQKERGYIYIYIYMDSLFILLHSRN